MIVMIIINVRLIQRKIVFGIMESRVIQDWEKLQTHHHKLCIVGYFLMAAHATWVVGLLPQGGPPTTPPSTLVQGACVTKKSHDDRTMSGWKITFHWKSRWLFVSSSWTVKFPVVRLSTAEVPGQRAVEDLLPALRQVLVVSKTEFGYLQRSWEKY